MRRHELQSRDPALLEEIAARCEVGHLALLTPDGPRAVALNFALRDGALWFHGALAGEKYEALRGGPRVGFTMNLPHSLIPSTWSATGHACPATHFFKSAEVRGTCAPVDAAAEKAAGLQALMEKYQPEGGFTPLDAGLKMYRGSLRKVGVFRVAIESWTGKLKFGVNEPTRLRRIWIGKLRERGRPLDLATADEIAKTLPPDA